jgi:hypothetical protein
MTRADQILPAIARAVLSGKIPVEAPSSLFSEMNGDEDPVFVEFMEKLLLAAEKVFAEEEGARSPVVLSEGVEQRFRLSALLRLPSHRYWQEVARHVDRMTSLETRDHYMIDVLPDYYGRPGGWELADHLVRSYLQEYTGGTAGKTPSGTEAWEAAGEARIILLGILSSQSPEVEAFVVRLWEEFESERIFLLALGYDGFERYHPVVEVMEPSLIAHHRYRLAEIVGKSFDPRGIPFLQKLSQHHDPNIRRTAIEALSEFRRLGEIYACEISGLSETP